MLSPRTQIDMWATFLCQRETSTNERSTNNNVHPVRRKYTDILVKMPSSSENCSEDVAPPNQPLLTGA